MDTTTLAATIADERKVRTADAEASQRFVTLEKKRAPAADRRDAAEKRLKNLRGKELLGEATPNDVAGALAEFNAADSALIAIDSALDDLRSRCEAAGPPVRAARARSEAAAREVATELAEAKLRALQAAAGAFAIAFRDWFEMSSVSLGGRITGETQQRAHSVAQILAAEGVRGGEFLQIGFSDGHGALLSPSAVLARAQELAEK